MQIHNDPRFQTLIEQLEALHLASRTNEMHLVLEQLQTLAETEQDHIGLAAAYLYLDILSDRKPGSADYMQYVKRALLISQAKNIPYYEMKASNSLGIMYSELADFHSSLEYYLRAIHIANEHPEYCYAGVVLNNVGNLFVWMEDYAEAVVYLERAYLKSVVENQNDTELLALIGLNLIELYSNLENDEKVQEWRGKSQEFLNAEEQSVVESIELINEARRLLQAGQNAAATGKICAFIEQSIDIPDYIYIFHCHMNALRLGIQLSDVSLCATLMQKMEELQGKAEMISFAYDYATVRVEYYQAFQEQLEESSTAFYQEYFTLSQERIKQLRNTYAKSLSVKIAFEEVKDENLTVHLKNEQLQKDIERDIFTNLYNKVSTKKHVSAAMKERAPGVTQGLLLIDIDLFKSINDNYGHVFGDQVITKVAEMLETLDESHKIAGRFGGDEFLVFLDKQDSVESIKHATDKIMERIRHCIQLPDKRIREITTSIGVCIIVSDMSFEDALMSADQALYRAKELGRNRYELSEYRQ